MKEKKHIQQQEEQQQTQREEGEERKEREEQPVGDTGDPRGDAQEIAETEGKGGAEVDDGVRKPSTPRKRTRKAKAEPRSLEQDEVVDSLDGLTIPDTLPVLPLKD